MGEREKMIKSSDITIIIPHLGADDQQRYSLEQCLESLRETVPNIVRMIAFNGVEYNITQHPEKSPNLIEKWIYIGEQGQNKAVNAAVATTNTPWIFITNDDMIYP